MQSSKYLTLAGATFAALLLVASALSAKTFVYCSEGSPENFTPAHEADAGQGRRR